MSATSVRISTALANASKQESRIMHRSQAGQIEYWARIGRAIEHSGLFDHAHIARALRAEIDVDDLTAYEKPVFDAMHDEAMEAATNAEQNAHEQRIRDFRKSGIDVTTLGD